jgi:protein kinase-like protein
VTAADSALARALPDRYQLERELGRGGMATVYLARDLKHDRMVAIKVLQPELAASLGPERFLREIKVVAGLQHPNILPVNDSGEAISRLWFAMPYVEGESLRARLAREGELPVGEAVRLLRDVVDALACAHQHGVVHRDIKPDNVLLSGHHAVVADFGVAKALSAAADDSALTSAGMAIGTPAYMAPEQATADPHADHRADIYAVGAMAYEMLTGRPPFTGPTPQAVLAAQLTDTPQSFAKARPSVPPALEALVLRCLEKRPADRWQSAGELLQRLESITLGEATATTATAPVTVKPGSASSRRLRVTAAVTLILLIAAGVWSWITVDEAAARYPDDPLVWNTVGEARAHLGFFVGGSKDTWVLEPFRRAIAADSAFAPAYIHPAELGLYTGGPASALRYVDAYLALGPRDKHADGMRLVRALLASGSTSPPDLARWLDSASANTLSGAYLTLWRVPDSTEAAIRLARLLAEGWPGEKPWSEPANGRTHLARQLLRRGHLQEAHAIVSDPQGFMRWQYLQAVLLGVIPPDSARLTFRRWLRDPGGWAEQALWWWAERGDTTSVRQFLTSQESVMLGRREALRPYYAQAAPAYLALARRDTARALEQLMALPDSLCPVCAYERLARVRLLSARGRDREAAVQLEAPIAQFPEALEVVWALERGRVNDRLGNRDKAIEAYSFVAQSWRRADPQLQPVVAEARAALSRLTGEPRR